MTSEQLKTHYVNPAQPGSYSGYGSFYHALKQKGIKPKSKKVKEWLMSQDTYTLHKPKRKKFPRNKVIVAGVDDTWQADLVDMQKFSRYNSGHRYIITCIDVFSKFAWAIPIKNKTGPTLWTAFKTIFETGRIPKCLQTDKGTEFLNQHVKKLLIEKNIKLYNVNSEMKACVVERFNRTLKEKMFRYFTHHNTNKYIDVIEDFLTSYNGSYHRTIGMAPNKVNSKNEKELWKKLFGYKHNYEEITYKYKIGDTVRISKAKSVFEKGYTPNWTEEIFTVSERLPRSPPVYKLTDLNGEVIKGIFYEQELQKIVKEKQVYKLEKILRTRQRNGKKEHLVRWLGYPPEFDSWVQATDIERIKKQ